MKTLNGRALLLCALAALVAAPPALADSHEGGTPHARLIESKADAIVSIKFVLTVDFGGSNREFNRVTTGVIVDPAGLVMIPANAMQMGFRFGRRGGAGPRTQPTNIRVIFPGSEKEYQAIMGAKDSKLGLAFLLIKDLEDRKPAPVDLSTTVEPKIGGVLYGVSRLSQGFDHAPMCDKVRVIGHTTKPRDLWVLAGGMSFLAEPLYDESGAVAGVVVMQEGVGRGAGSQVCLLPLKIAKATVSRALKESRKELDRILEEEEEAAAEKEDEEAEEKEAEKKEGGDAKKDDDGAKKDK